MTSAKVSGPTSRRRILLTGLLQICVFLAAISNQTPACTAFFYQSMTPPERITCGRFKIATERLATASEISVDLFR